MKRQTSEWTVRMLADLRGRINTEAEYQRGEVWSEPQQQLLIDSILRGFDLPKIFLRRLKNGPDFLFDVVDGVQRLTSIWRFLSDEYPLPRSYLYQDFGQVGGKSWSELPLDAKDRLQFTKITVTELEDTNEDEIRELFQRLQQGEPLNAAERRNAMLGPVRDFVAKELAEHPLWPLTMLKQRRFGWHEMSAIILALVRENGATDLKGADLHNLYEDRSFDPQSHAAKSTIGFMDRLAEIARIEPDMIRTRWGIVDLLLSLMQLKSEGNTPHPDEVAEFFQRFEDERRRGSTELSDLRITVIDLPSDRITKEEMEPLDIKLDMLVYINAFAREGAAKENVRARSKVMVNRLRQFLL